MRLSWSEFVVQWFRAVGFGADGHDDNAGPLLSFLPHLRRKAAAGSARARVVAAELLDEFSVQADDPVSVVQGSDGA